MSMPTRTTWGATRAGRTGLALWGPALGVGIVLAGALGGLVYAVSPSDTSGALGLVAGLGALPLGTVLGWVLLVDRSSIAGAVDRPEESVESQWLERASAGALSDGLAAIGLGAGAIAVTGVDHAAEAVLVALWILLSLDVGVRYLVLRRAV